MVQRTELGYKVIVNNLHWGLLYSNEIFGDVNIGDRRTAYIKRVRPDGKIDVTLEMIEKMRVEHLSDAILAYLQSHGGSMNLTDKSEPKAIQDAFECSKKDFKKALGLLYKQKKVMLGAQTTLVKEEL